jgi:tetratricopeptide (TPR) repeat protein
MGRRKHPKRARTKRRAAAPSSEPAAAEGRGLAALLAAPAVGLLAFLVYLNALGGDFVWDDRPLILGDYMVKSFDHLDHLFTNDFFFRDENDLAYGYYRPLTTLTYVLDYALHADDPFGFHVTNALLHAICSALAVVLLMRLELDWRAAALAGALFAVHPIHTENVAWIAGRTDLVAFALVAVSLLLHLASVERSRGTLGRRVLAAGSVVVFALAMLAKEMAIVGVAWLALQHLVLRRDGWRRTAWVAAPYLVVVVLYGFWRFSVLGVPVPGQSEAGGTVEALLSLAPTWVRYVGWVVLPIEQSAYVQNPYVNSLADWRFLSSVAALLFAAVLVWKLARSRPRLLFVALAAVASFAPISNLVRVAGPEDMGAIMAERFVYFPSLWLLTLVAMGALALLRRAGERRWARGLVWVAVAAALVSLAGATVARNRVWRSEPVLFEDALEHAPDAALIWGNLANYHLRSGDLEEAKRTLEKLEELDPESYFARSSRALWHVMEGRYDDAMALQERIVESSRRKNPVATNNLAYLYRVTGRTAKARKLLEALIEQGSDYSDVRFNLAEIQRQDGEFSDARENYHLALRDRPDSRQIGTALAQMELHRGRFAEAQEVFEGLLEYHPDNAGLLNNLAVVHRRRGQLDQAITALERALERDPDYAKARMNYADLLVETERIDEARKQLERIVESASESSIAEVASERLAELDGER